MAAENLAHQNQDNDSVQGRRKFPRREYTRSVGILIAGQFEVRMGIEIGEGGISFDSEQALPEGTIAVVSFQIPNGSFVSTAVEVRTSDVNEGTGVFTIGSLFTNIKFDFKREIRAYVSARS